MKVEKCGEYHAKILGKQIRSLVYFQRVIIDSLIHLILIDVPEINGLI